MEITVNIVDTLFDSIPKGTVVANYVVEIADNIESLDYLMKIYKAFHLTIESCTFYGKDKVNKGLYSYGDVQSYYHYINNNRFVNLVNGVYLSYNSNAATVSNNEFYLCTNCVLIDSSNGCRIENNTFQNYVTTANRPTGVNAGFQYFDTSLSKYICWNGTTWTNLDGTALN
jgi:parallel beta-helix repeat protein